MTDSVTYGLTAEEIAREIRAQLDEHRLIICGEPMDDMWEGPAAEALRGVANRFARLFMERNRGFNAAAFDRECGLTGGTGS